MLDVAKIREDFPFFKNNKLIYFDNAATSQKPEVVINAIKNFYEKLNANVHRGVHTLSQEASRLYEEAHDIIAKFIGGESIDEIIFTKGTTESLNMVAYVWGLNNLNEEDEVLVTIMDHHSNMLPWITLSRIRGFKVRFVNITDDGYIDYEDLESKLSKKVRVVAIPHASNVLGTVNDVKRVSKLAHSVGAIVVLDAAQSTPHIPINVKELDIDFMGFSGHKMLGPTGIGVLYIRKDLLKDITPTIAGGGTITLVPCNSDFSICKPKWAASPWKLEAGTPNIAGAIGLAEAVRYLTKIGMENIWRHEIELVRYTYKRFEELDNLHYYGPKRAEDKVGVVAFNVKNINHHEVAGILDMEGIAVRSGHHCAHPLHQRLGIEGSVRASYYLYNTHEEIDKMIEVLSQIF